VLRPSLIRVLVSLIRLRLTLFALLGLSPATGLQDVADAREEEEVLQNAYNTYVARRVQHLGDRSHHRLTGIRGQSAVRQLNG
jgi:hypothetical protein